MKKVIIGVLGILLCLAQGGFLIVQNVRSGYRYQKEISSHWQLADKSSTIKAKAEHVDMFVAALEASGLNGTNDALFFPTLDNSFDANFAALKTLQARLHEIETMDVTSFQYQTAIQQITQQEQGEAEAMLKVFEGTWTKQHYFYLYDTIQEIHWIALVILFVVFIIIGIVGLDETF